MICGKSYNCDWLKRLVRNTDKIVELFAGAVYICFIASPENLFNILKKVCHFLRIKLVPACRTALSSFNETVQSLLNIPNEIYQPKLVLIFYNPIN